MRNRQQTVRALVVVGLAAAAAAAAPAVASAKPFDSQPTPLFCAAGMAPVQSLVASESPVIPGGQVFYAINEQGGDGAMIGWLNLMSGANGTTPMVPTQLVPTADAKAPLALAETGAGPVFSAVFGTYQNAAGETCLLVPGFTFNEVPAATDDAAAAG